MAKFRKIIDRLIEFVMAISSLTLAIVTIIQVFTRFVLKNPIAWGQDIVRLSFIYLVFWGGAYCVKEKGHLNIDILLTALRGKKKLVMELFINIVLLVFFGFIIHYGIGFTRSGMSQKAPYLDIPMALYYAALPTAGGLMAFYIIGEIISQIKVIFDKSGGVIL